MKPYIIIPTYNEAKNIISLLDAVLDMHISGLQVLVVDDNSPDGTASLIEAKQYTNVTVLQRKEKLGIGSAYVAGFQHALDQGATHVFEMDADFSHDPKDIPRLLHTCKTADVAIGSRKVPGGSIVGWGIIRQAMSGGAMWFSRLILGLKTKDVTAGFRCFRANVLRSIEIETIKSNGYAFQEELLYKVEKHGFSVVEVPVTFSDRQHGASKLSKKDIIEFFNVMIALRFGKHS